MPRPIWNGTISFDLLNIPVQLMPGERHTDLQFRMLDSRNHARIRGHQEGARRIIGCDGRVQIGGIRVPLARDLTVSGYNGNVAAQRGADQAAPRQRHEIRCGVVERGTDRAAGAAVARRGNHTSGTERVRPSANSTTSSSSVHRTLSARGSICRVKELIPSLQKRGSVFLHKPGQLVQLMRG